MTAIKRSATGTGFAHGRIMRRTIFFSFFSIPVLFGCATTPCPSAVPEEKCICPVESTIDCMPVVPEERAELCDGPLHDWIVENCTGVEFTS